MQRHEFAAGVAIATNVIYTLIASSTQVEKFQL